MGAKRVVISAGGTGGHLYPAQALAEELIGSNTLKSEILFVAGGLTHNRYFDRDRFSFKEIACGPLYSLNPFKCLKALKILLKGIRESVNIFKEFKPNVIVGFGSYHALAPLLAARWLGIPIILHEANSVPGKANQFMAPFASAIGLHFPSTFRMFKGKAFHVGLPLRTGYRLADIDKAIARAHFGLSNNPLTLLICGGSQGSRAINHVMRDCIPVLQHLAVQVIHLTGDPKSTIELTELYETNKIVAHVKTFETQMQMAWRAADLFIGRGGASTIAESIEFEVPGIIIPYPHSTDGHQEKNADFLVKTIGGACKLLEKELTVSKLTELLSKIACSIHDYQKSLRDYKKRPHQLSLCELVLNGSHYE